MAISKKASAKKLATKKSSAAKTKVKAAAKVTRKKRAKPTPKNEAAQLNKQFIYSLAKLVSYWEKQVKSLTKQLNSQEAKLSGSLSKQKSTISAKKAEKLKLLQETITHYRQELTVASHTANKFIALNKHIEQFEHEWLSQATKTQDAMVATQEQPAKPSKRSRNSREPLPTENLEKDGDEESNPEMVNELEDIFMPQEELSEFEVIEDFSVMQDDDLFDDEDNE